MDFDETSKALRLKYLHPGVSKDDVIAQTGFDLIVPEHVEETPLPSPSEIEIIRERIDVNGMLRH